VGVAADNEDGAHFLKIDFTWMNGALEWSPSLGSRAR
jgi:hypothetical protein